MGIEKWVSRVYNYGMFVRKKKNKSGTISVQIIFKQRGKYRVAKTIGSSKDPERIELLMSRANEYLRHPDEQPPLFSTLSETDIIIKNFVENTSNPQIRTVGPETIFGTLFDRIGFNAVPVELFRHIVIARLAYPTSKLKTVDYLYRYRGLSVDVSKVYRFLDTLNRAYKEKVERIAYEYTKKTLGNISVVFYDMTTLYFEAEDEDDLRKIGFSKDGKFQCPQIMIGLLVGEGGYPIGYDIFEGNTFEGHTLIPTLEKIQKKYGFDRPVVVADAGLLSKDNIEKLIAQAYEFILGARIKNEKDAVKTKILELAKDMKDGDSFSLEKTDGTRLIVTFSDKRARKDRYNREKGLKRLKKNIKSGKLTKQHINNRGYNKFLVLEGEVEVKIDEMKMKYDEVWDGLKGYVTNTTLEPAKIVEHYGHLWQIEKAFRISKSDLRIRPIFHRAKRRIEAHICIAFVAYAIYKELERLLVLYKIEMSPKRAAELTHTMYEMEYVLPHSKRTERTKLKNDAEQQTLYDVVHR